MALCVLIVGCPHLIFLFCLVPDHGVFHQYDSVAYPHVESGSKVVRLLKKGWKKGWNFITGGSSAAEDEITLPSQDVMQSEALRFYLDAHKNTLCKFIFPCSFNASVATDGIMGIFKSLRYVQHCVEDREYEHTCCLEVHEVSRQFLDGMLFVMN